MQATSRVGAGMRFSTYGTMVQPVLTTSAALTARPQRGGAFLHECDVSHLGLGRSGVCDGWPTQGGLRPGANTVSDGVFEVRKVTVVSAPVPAQC